MHDFLPVIFVEKKEKKIHYINKYSRAGKAGRYIVSKYIFHIKEYILLKHDFKSQIVVN